MAAYRPSARAAQVSRARRAVVAVGLGVALLAASAACGGDSSGDDASSDAGTNITMSHGYTDAEAAALKMQTDKWNTEHPTMKVNLLFNGGNDSALQKTIAGFTAGNYPDVAYEYGSSAAQLARQPKLVDLTFTSKPSGLTLELNGAAFSTPRTWTAWEGWQLSVNAPDQGRYAFISWSDGGGRSHVITAPASATTYQATFRKRPPR